MFLLDSYDAEAVAKPGDSSCMGRYWGCRQPLGRPPFVSWSSFSFSLPHFNLHLHELAALARSLGVLPAGERVRGNERNRTKT